jgi:hypothetical protein
MCDSHRIVQIVTTSEELWLVHRYHDTDAEGHLRPSGPVELDRLYGWVVVHHIDSDGQVWEATIEPWAGDIGPVEDACGCTFELHRDAPEVTRRVVNRDEMEKLA